jgi:hypothetical protein
MVVLRLSSQAQKLLFHTYSPVQVCKSNPQKEGGKSSDSPISGFRVCFLRLLMFEMATVARLESNPLLGLRYTNILLISCAQQYELQCRNVNILSG